MRFKFLPGLAAVILLITSCQMISPTHTQTAEFEPTSQYKYQLGLGYGFLGKEVMVTIDEVEVLSLVGTEEIENFAQMQGTYMLVSGYSPDNEITIEVTIDGNLLYAGKIDLSSGVYIHIYLSESGLNIYNTPHLIFE